MIMKNNELEQHLEIICKEQIEAPDHLVAATKRKLSRNPFLSVLISLSLLVNALIMISTIVGLLWPGLGWAEKLLWFFGSSVTFNGLVVLMLLKRDKVTSFFREFSQAVDH